MLIKPFLDGYYIGWLDISDRRDRISKKWFANCGDVLPEFAGEKFPSVVEQLKETECIRIKTTSTT